MIIGIDLGTTNSLVSYFSEDGPKIIPNRLGAHITPSVVSMDEEEQIYVGELAVERKLLYPDSAASVFKRDMGNQKKFSLLHKEFTAEELSSFVLRSLKEDAEHFLGEKVTEAVISVPAYFNDERRRATKRAGALAGLKVERIISEPTAAAIAYGLYKNKENARFLVFDLGGGTFDVSILELFDDILEVHAVAGDNYLGGEDFTNVIERMFFEHFPEVLQMSLDEKTRGYIHKQANLCKLGFSGEKNSVMECRIQGEFYRFEINQKEYEIACSELLERIKRQIQRSLSDAKIRVADIDKIVLVGGATKSPIIRKFVAKLFRKLPDININPDEAVALGAAIQAAMKERKEIIQEVVFTDVCPFTLGTEVVREWTAGKFETGIFCPIIERNTVIPTSRTERLYTAHDNQECIRVNVLQGESRVAGNNLSLGELIIDIPKAPAGVEAVDVTYTYDINSILEVEVTVLSTNEKKRKVFYGRNNNQTSEEIEERFKALSYLKIHPRDREENKYLLLRGERMYEEKLGEERQILDHMLHEFEEALNSYDVRRIESSKEKLRKMLEQMERKEIY
jgi:molecular chaperone HscC